MSKLEKKKKLLHLSLVGNLHLGSIVMLC